MSRPYSRPPELTEREQLVLRLVVKHYVASAQPIGSEFLVRQGHLQWSAATVRSTFARLEEQGFIEHLHTSAGRMPTEKGYRHFVDTLDDARVHHRDATALQALPLAEADAEAVLRGVAQLLGRISGQLSLIAVSYTRTGVLHKLELMPLSSTRVLVVLAVQSGAVRSVVLEIPAEIPAGLFEYVASMLNERLHGRTLAEVRQWCDARLNTADAPEASIIRMILCAPRLLDVPGESDSVYVSGAPNVLRHPEFQQTDRLQTIMELIDDDAALKDVLRDLPIRRNGASVTIGAEHSDARLRGCSTIAAQFQWGDVEGCLSVLGPTRLEYDRLAPLVAFVAHSLSTPRL